MIKVVFMGTPDVTVPVLHDLNHNSDNDLLAVYTSPDKESGRGRAITISPVKSYAMEHDLELKQPVTLRNPIVQQELSKLSPDVIIVAGYGKFLPPEVLRIPAYGCLNIHPSLLPLYRGPSPVISSILSGDKSTGATLMLLDEGMDSGPIINQVEIDIESKDTAESLTKKLFTLGSGLLTKYLNGWVSGSIEPRPQNEALATITRKINRADGEVNWTTSTGNLVRQCRAFTPWPGLYTHWNNKLIKFHEVELPKQMPSIKYDPGKVIHLEDSELLIGITTGDGVLGIKRLQIEGKSPTSIDQFILGYPAFIGAEL